MPRMTMLPLLASRMAWCMARVNAAVFATVWSAGVTTSIGSSPSDLAASAARVKAGAVLRPTGSSKAAPSSMPASRSCSDARNRCSSPVTIKGLAIWMSSAPSATKRCAAIWNRLSLPVSERNCLGKPARERGHRRVPEPPHRMTGVTLIMPSGLSGRCLGLRPLQPSAPQSPTSTRRTLPSCASGTGWSAPPFQQCPGG